MEDILRLPVIEPRHYQYAFYKAMDMGCKRSVKSWPRRAGKDISDFQFLVRQAMRRKGTYYYYFPTLELAKKALWDNIVEFYSHGELVASGSMIDILCPPEIRKTKNNSDHFIRLSNDSIIKIGGTDKLDVVGMNGYGYVFSEWQSQKKEAFGYISPILQENGGWALFNGTMRGKRNHLYQDWNRTKDLPEWFSQWLSPEDTLEYYWINEEEGISVNPQLEGRIHHHTLRPYQNIQSIVDAGEISFALAKQEYLNRADNEIAGGYYGYEMRALQKRGDYKITHDNGDLVYTFWDLGGDKEDSDKTCVLFARIDIISGHATVIDYYEDSGHLRGHYIDYVQSKPYTYGGHYIPHDGKRSNVWTGEGMVETVRNEYGLEFRYITKSNSVMNDIEITRRGLAKTTFDKDKCEEVFDHVSNYHEKETTGKPCHQNSCRECNGASHGADTVRYMRMAIHLGLVAPYIITRERPDWMNNKPDKPEEEWFCV